MSERLDIFTSERFLLETYHIKLPDTLPTIEPGPIDHISKQIMQLAQPAVLEEMEPIQIYGDGNCTLLEKNVSKLYNAGN